MLKAKDFHQNVAILFSILCHSVECKSYVWDFIDISFLLNMHYSQVNEATQKLVFFD